MEHYEVSVVVTVGAVRSISASTLEYQRPRKVEMRLTRIHGKENILQFTPWLVRLHHLGHRRTCSNSVATHKSRKPDLDEVSLIRPSLSFGELAFFAAFKLLVFLTRYIAELIVSQLSAHGSELRNSCGKRHGVCFQAVQYRL